MIWWILGGWGLASIVFVTVYSWLRRRELINWEIR